MTIFCENSHFFVSARKHRAQHAQAHSREKTVGADYAEWLADRISLLAQACSLPEYVSALRQRQTLTHTAMAEGGPPPGRSHTENAQEVESGDAPSTETRADGGEAVDPEQGSATCTHLSPRQMRKTGPAPSDLGIGGGSPLANCFNNEF